MIENRWNWALRWLIAAGLIATIVLMARANEFGILLGLPLLVIAAFFVMPEIMKPVSWMVDSLFGTGPGPGGRPPLDLRLAQHYVKQERLKDAIEEYERIQGFYPGIPETYEQMMLLTAQIGGSRKAIDSFFAQGKRQIKDPESRGDLQRAYDEALEILQASSADSLPNG